METLSDGGRSLSRVVLHIWTDELVWNISFVVCPQSTRSYVPFQDLLDRFVTALGVLLLGELSSPKVSFLSPVVYFYHDASFGFLSRASIVF